MLRRFSVNFAVLSLLVDALLVAAALSLRSAGVPTSPGFPGAER